MVFLPFSKPVQCEEAGPSSSSSSSSSGSQTKTGSAIDAVKKAAEKTTDAVKSTASSLNPLAPEPELVRWRRNFETNAKVGEDGEKYLDEDSFISAIAPAGDFDKITRRQYSILFRVACPPPSSSQPSPSSSQRVTWDDFVVFESLLRRPDAEFQVAFKVFDVDGNGLVTFDEFKRVFGDNLGKGSLPFDFESPWVKLYLGRRGGRKGEHVLRYNEFTQLMKGLQGERLRQAFHHFDKEETGYINPSDFTRIVRELAEHKLSDSVLERLPSLCTITQGGKISYSEAVAFHNVIREMDMVEKIIKEATSKSPDGKISKADFQNMASKSTRYVLFSPMEVDIIFHFASGLNGGSSSVGPTGTGGGIMSGAGGSGGGKSSIQDGRLSVADFGQLLDPKWNPGMIAGGDGDEGKPRLSALEELFRGVYKFGLGGIAGAVGATAVYPIDLVKTRMQNQRSKVVGELLYKNSMDCVRKVYKNEGFLGFYKGLPPQLIGVAPEKAIKLTVNDEVRRFARNPETGKVALPWEFIAGGSAGGCQVIFTNPLEIVKIRLQMQGEAAKAGQAVPRGALHIIRQLGLFGLYRGAGACLCRDIPFSAIYFPAYSHLRTDLFREGKDGKKLTFLEMLAAASIAGMPAAYLTTPADVIKTRLQSEARKGETHYKGIAHCFTTILAEEGPRALYKGGIARVLRSSPQFGVTLVAYDYLQKLLPYPFDKDSKRIEIIPKEEDLSRIRARNALKILLDVHSDFANVKRSS